MLKIYNDGKRITAAISGDIDHHIARELRMELDEVINLSRPDVARQRHKAYAAFVFNYPFHAFTPFTKRFDSPDSFITAAIFGCAFFIRTSPP